MSGFRACQDALRKHSEEEALENIQDAIQEYLAVVDELTQEGEK